MSIGPDDYTEATTAELEEKDFAVLARVWPGAFRACGALLLMVEDEEVALDSPLMDLNLFELVQQSFGVES